jgi:hypothetical protein
MKTKKELLDKFFGCSSVGNFYDLKLSGFQTREQSLDEVEKFQRHNYGKRGLHKRFPEYELTEQEAADLLEASQDAAQEYILQNINRTR